MPRVLTEEQRKKASERQRRWRTANREKINKRVREYRRRRYIAEGCWRDEGPKAKEAKALREALKSQPCADCGGTFPTCCMDFDHRHGEVKVNNVGNMFARHYSKETILAEVAKCDLVCANCHRIRTRDRRTGSGAKQ